jgi:hypothetical protein
MEIRKSAISNLSVGTLVRQRDAVVPAVRPENESRNLAKTVSGYPRDEQRFSPDELQAALKAVQQREYRSAGEATASSAGMGGRARRALDAYLAQQNLPQEEGNSALSAMLGVDYFA